MLFSLYAEIFYVTNLGLALDVLLFIILFSADRSSGVNFFGSFFNANLNLSLPLLNIRKWSVWRPYFKKDGYLGYLVDLTVWK